MRWFDTWKTTRTIGVDVGTASVKVVELHSAKGGRVELSTYGIGALPLDTARRDSDEIIAIVGDALGRAYAEAGMKAKKGFASLPGFSVMSQEVALGPVPEDRIAEAVEREARVVLKDQYDEYMIDWEQIKEPIITRSLAPQGPAMVRVLMSVAPKRVVERYARMFEYAGLKLVSLETEAMALVRALVGRDPTLSMILDMGATTSDIITVESALPRISRSVRVGGRTITDALAQRMAVSSQEADVFKRNISDISAPVAAVLRPVVEELSEAINDVRKRTGSAPERLLLAGGSAKLSALQSYLSDRTGVRVRVGNPFARVLYPPELQAVLPSVAPDLAVAIGLAMRHLY